MPLLAAPVLRRFRHHFRADSPTNRLDKPHWMFDHVLSVVAQTRELFSTLSSTSSSSSSSSSLSSSSSSSSFLSSPFRHFVARLVAAVADKLHAEADALLGDDALLRLWLDSARRFDLALLDDFSYPASPAEPEGGSPPLPTAIGAIASEPRLLGAWLSVERNTARALYARFAEPEGSWRLEAHQSARCAPPRARAVLELLSESSARCRLLPSVALRLAFLERVQLPLLQRFLRDLAALLAESGEGRERKEETLPIIDALNGAAMVAARAREALCLGGLFDIPPEGVRAALGELAEVCAEMRALLVRAVLRRLPQEGSAAMGHALVALQAQLSRISIHLIPSQYVLFYTDLTKPISDHAAISLVAKFSPKINQ